MGNPTRCALLAVAATVLTSSLPPAGSADSTRATILLQPLILPSLRAAEESPSLDLGPAARLLSPRALVSAPALTGSDWRLHAVEQPGPAASGAGRTVPWLLAGAIAAAFITFVVLAAMPSTSQ